MMIIVVVITPVNVGDVTYELPFLPFV